MPASLLQLSAAGRRPPLQVFEARLMRRVPWIVSGASSVMAVITWQVVFISGMHEGLGAGFIGNHFSCLHGHIWGCFAH
jgi:hypothetical protein